MALIGMIPMLLISASAWAALAASASSSACLRAFSASRSGGPRRAAPRARGSGDARLWKRRARHPGLRASRRLRPPFRLRARRTDARPSRDRGRAATRGARHFFARPRPRRRRRRRGDDRRSAGQSHRRVARAPEATERAADAKRLIRTLKELQQRWRKSLISSGVVSRFPAGLSASLASARSLQ